MSFRKEPVKTDNAQRSLLAIVMLGILLVCVAVAWYLVQSRTVYPQSAAKEILEEIRSQGLASYWHDKPQHQFYVMLDLKRRPATWEYSMREAAGDGYVGRRIQRRNSREVISEAWKINREATKGEYTGSRVIPDEPISSVARINLADGKVAVEWVAMDGTVVQKTAAVPAPAQYVPEGLMPLVISMVAKRGRDATFATLDNNNSISVADGLINFTTLKMSPKGQMVEVSSSEASGVVLQYFLDDSGEIETIREVGPGGSADFRLVTGQELLEQFPYDPVVAALVQQAAQPAKSQPAEEPLKTQPAEAI